MSVVTHKYTPAEMSDQELEATFAARGHTVDYLVKTLRDQIKKGTLSSYVITGPRGAGKSTVIQMVDLRIRQDPELNAAWIPIIFPEEQFNMISLRDMLAAILQMLVKQNIPSAQAWLDKVENELNEEQSEQLAITGLREIARNTGRRFVLFIENLDHLLEEHLDDKMKGTLRRLLMSDAFMLILGSTVHIFDALKDYDEAFFNYFGQVPLDRLNADQVSELLRKRAEYDQNERFLNELPKQQAKIKTLVHLTGGNPRFVLMLYELLSLQQVTTIVQYLRRLVDELTPLLKDEMENLPPQQRKIIHALMERGGTAQPSDLTGPTRLPLNAITTQLKRLKEAQIVEVLGGGKGRAANYTVPDKLFSIWYQMRYLSQNRRRIEIFVEVLRIWFAEEERLETLRQLVKKTAQENPHTLRDSATTAEYFAASLKDTIHQKLAIDLCIDSWVKTDLDEAAFAYADLSRAEILQEDLDDLVPHTRLATWLNAHSDTKKAIEALDRILVNKAPYTIKHARALILRGLARFKLDDIINAINDFEFVLKIDNISLEARAMALIWLGISVRDLGDKNRAIEYLTRAISINARTDFTIRALITRGGIKRSKKDAFGAMEDLNSAINLEIKPTSELAEALVDRALEKWKLKDENGAFTDIDNAIKITAISNEELAQALILRAIIYINRENYIGALADFTRVIDLKPENKQITISGGVFAYSLALILKDQKQTNDILQHFTTAIKSLSEEDGREIIIRFLVDLSELADADEWAEAWQMLTSRLDNKVLEAIQFFGSVCKVLKGENRILLDALPPEQREFALKILTKFELKPKSSKAKKKKLNYRNRVAKND